jgi:hypothetical protein
MSISSYCNSKRADLSLEKFEDSSSFSCEDSSSFSYEDSPLFSSKDSSASSFGLRGTSVGRGKICKLDDHKYM